MVRAGDMIEHPISGETMIFLQTGSETNGELLQIDLFVAPNGAVGVEHVHPNQEERFIVRRGELTLSIDGKQRILRAGDEATVPAGVPHEWWNHGALELNAVVEFRPAGRFEGFVSSYFGLAKAGHVNEEGIPGLLQMAVSLHEYRDTVVLTGMHAAMRNLVLPVLSVIGRGVGLRADYPYPVRAHQAAAFAQSGLGGPAPGGWTAGDPEIGRS